jgi:hypothetical protein
MIQDGAIVATSGNTLIAYMEMSKTDSGGVPMGFTDQTLEQRKV